MSLAPPISEHEQHRAIDLLIDLTGLIGYAGHAGFGKRNKYSNRYKCGPTRPLIVEAARSIYRRKPMRTTLAALTLAAGLGLAACQPAAALSVTTGAIQQAATALP
jgi:hypothetical protein